MRTLAHLNVVDNAESGFLSERFVVVGALLWLCSGSESLGELVQYLFFLLPQHLSDVLFVDI